MNREELLSIIEKNSKIGLNELAVLLGEESAYFENIRSIKSYSPLKIEIFLRKGLLTIEGEQLFIKKYCGGDLIVCGKIKAIIRT